MKILVIHCVYHHKSGEEKVVEEEVKLLKEAGHRVQLLLFSNEGAAMLKFLQLPFNVSSYRKTKKAIREFVPDVVHVHNLHFAASPSVLYAAKHCRIPVVYTLHNFRLLCPSGILFHNEKIFLHSLRSQFPWKAVFNGVYRKSKLLTFWLAFSTKVHHWLGTWNLPDRCIVLTSHAKEIFLCSNLNVRKEKFVVKPNFCSLPDSDTFQRTEAFLFVGRLSTDKGVRLLLKSFSHLPYRLIIAGDGPLKDEVIAYTKLHSNISYAGLLPKQELSVLMKQSAALVFPSIWFEGMPLTIIEAFANGLPVIASKLGAMEYMIMPAMNGLLFEAGNEEDLKSKLEQWSDLPLSEKERFSLQARETYKSDYTPEKNAGLLSAIYKNIRSPKLEALRQLEQAKANELPAL